MGKGEVDSGSNARHLLAVDTQSNKPGNAHLCEIFHLSRMCPPTHTSHSWFHRKMVIVWVQFKCHLVWETLDDSLLHHFFSHLGSHYNLFISRIYHVCHLKSLFLRKKNINKLIFSILNYSVKLCAYLSDLLDFCLLQVNDHRLFIFS